MRAAPLIAALLLTACGEQEAAQDAGLIKAARAGMNAVRGLPGGQQATFTAVRLVGADTVCGMIDGNDGDGPRPFATNVRMTLVIDPHEKGSRETVARMCSGQPVREITSRNAQFTDLSVAH